MPLGYYNLNEVINQKIDNLKRYIDTRPLVLGGIATSGGGSLGRPTGYIGQLSQLMIAYDKTEAAISGVAPSGSLVDNLNHIRYDIQTLEDADSTVVVKDNGVVVSSGITILDYGTGFTITESPTGEANVEIEGAYAEIYVADGSTSQSIATGTTYTKLTGFTTDGEEHNCTADSSNDKITFTKTGKYLVICTINGSSDTANVEFRYAAFLNSVEQDKLHAHRKYSTANDVGSCSVTGIIDVTTTSWDLDIRTRHDNAGSIDFTPTYMNLSVTYIGET